MLILSKLITGYLCNSEFCALLAPKKAISNVCGFYYVWLVQGVGYPIVDINSADYICAISVLLT